jgi:hypothetical protein
MVTKTENYRYLSRDDRARDRDRSRPETNRNRASRSRYTPTTDRSIMKELNYSILVEDLINIFLSIESSDSTKVWPINNSFIKRFESVRIREMELRVKRLESRDDESSPVAVRASCNQVIFLFKTLMMIECSQYKVYNATTDNNKSINSS